jgi:integrase
MLKRRDMHFDDLPFPKTPRKLPTVLSPEEVRHMIDGTTNLMHRTLLMVLYGTGVRRTELSLLKVAEVDSKRMVIHIRQGKESRDREVPLSPKLLEALREYWLWKKPRVYLFPSSTISIPVEFSGTTQSRLLHIVTRYPVLSNDSS